MEWSGVEWSGMLLICNNRGRIEFKFKCSKNLKMPYVLYLSRI